MSIAKRVFQLATTIMVILVLLVAFFLVGVRLIGFYPYTVLSGSMEPTYHVGAIIYVKKVDPLTLKVGDPVTFMMNEDTVATHRIVEVIPDESDPTLVRFRTKGDNNDVIDGGELHCKNVIGKPVFSIPYMGYLAEYLQNSAGRYVLFGLCGVLLLSAFLPGDKKKKGGSDPAADDASDKEDDTADVGNNNDLLS